MQHEVYLCTGSNLGNRAANLKMAADLISEKAGACSRISSVYVTEPWGIEEQDAFYNQALLIKTSLDPDNLIKILLEIETEMGRKRELKWGPRLIDIDIIFYDREIINHPGLKIPHPEMQGRRFVLAPLAEIAPDFIHPQLHKNMNELLHECNDHLKVEII